MLVDCHMPSYSKALMFIYAEHLTFIKELSLICFTCISDITLKKDPSICLYINYSKKGSFHYLTTNSASPHGMGFIYTREGKAEDPNYLNAGFRFLFWKLQNMFLPVCRNEV